MKAVIDTNVFVSGIFWKGSPHQVLLAWQKGYFRPVVSPPVLEEYRRVLTELASRHIGVRYEPILELVELHAEVVSPVTFVRPVCSDHDDDKFLEAALASGAGYVVSGDKALLTVDGHHGLKVISPHAFLKELRKAELTAPLWSV